ncbi:dihydrodipicolinate synthase family protein [Candidatus Roseilinea sp. NK_OTU-006]|uniref:dihydrodipicolinate synthase family protein n=1 Tax=Candidatus Roseilinea sp. NK_OTU-006 TaxID=2704250 RepID=UPI001F0B0CE3|nr:dihydrodipicolinate synthase family protein [Candidatus Roseilinea sp. NK_OTU-006]
MSAHVNAVRRRAPGARKVCPRPDNALDDVENSDTIGPALHRLSPATNLAMNNAHPHPIAGVLPVFQTPYHEDETIDFETLEKEIHWLFDQGADGIVMAMVSETLRLSSDERRALAEAACAIGGPRGAVIISVGAESSRVAEDLARHAEAVGADAVMAIPPLATHADESEIGRYYARILSAVSIPVIVQDASGYVGRPMSIALQADLFNTHGPRVMFKPEAHPIGPRLSELRYATGGRARIFEGSGGAALTDSYARGIAGVMPGADLVDVIVALWRALKAGDAHMANRLSAPLSALVGRLTNLDAFLAVEKHLLVKRGVFKNAIVRGPVGYRLDADLRGEVDRLFDELQAVLSDAASADLRRASRTV